MTKGRMHMGGKMRRTARKGGTRVLGGLAQVEMEVRTMATIANFRV